MNLCKCTVTERKIIKLGYWDGCPLEGKSHTSFDVNQCMECGGICGFPQPNFELALQKGTEATKNKLAEIIDSVPADPPKAASL